MRTAFEGGRGLDGGPIRLVVSDREIVDGDLPVDHTVDLGGRLVLPALGEPHAHLDKALLADRFPNPGGDLVGAVEVMRAGWSTVDPDDIVERASAAVQALVASGTTLIRSHADTAVFGGLKSMRALTAVRATMREICDVEVVAMAYPVTGSDGDEGRAVLDEAIGLSPDLIGGVPHLEPEPERAIDHLLRLAKETALPLDLHTDELLDAEADTLRYLAHHVIAHGMEGRVTASHCVSHGLKPPEEQAEIAAMVADAGISVVTLPRTNLYLQARGIRQAPPRGTVGVDAMLEAGVVVAGGGDNCQDPFSAIGKNDPLETAALLVLVNHRTVAEAFEMVSSAVRAACHRPAVTLEPGSPAEFVAVDASSLGAAVAERTADRIVVHRGRVVARTELTRRVGA